MNREISAAVNSADSIGTSLYSTELEGEIRSTQIDAAIINPVSDNAAYATLADKINTMPRAVFASQLGFRSGSANTAANTNTFRQFLRNSHLYALILDNDYYIGTTQTEPAHDILIIGNGHRLIIDDISGGYGLIKANNYGLFFENVVFTVGSAFASISDNNKNYKANVVYAAKGYTQTLGEIAFRGCGFTATGGSNPGAVWANPSPDPEFTLDTVNHGFSAVRLSGCSIVNNTNIIVTIYDMPGTVEITACRVKNMRARIVTVGVRSPNDTNFVARAQELGLATADAIKTLNQNIRRQISLYVHDNSIKNDIIINDISAQYICFVWMKGGKAVATGNRIEDIAVNLARNARNAPTEVFPMYLLAEDVFFSENICKNIYNFAYDPTAVTGSEDKLYYTHSILPNVKMYQGEKIISNNTFVLEESFLAAKCSELGKTINDLWPVVFIEMYDDGDRLNINNNVFNTYFMQFSRMNKRRYDGVVRISGNTFTIDTLGKADGTENKRNDLIMTYGGNYIISDNYFQIGSIETDLNFLTGEEPPSGVENTFVTQLTVKGNCFDIGQLRGSFNIIYAPNNGKAVINDNEIIIDDYRQVFRLLYGNNIPAMIKNNHIDIKSYNLTSQIGGILQESANIKGSDLAISYEVDGGLPQSAGNIVLGSRRLSLAAKFFSPAYATYLLQLFVENRTLSHPADKTYTYFIRLRAYSQGIDELIKLIFLPYGTASYKLRYRAASGYIEKTAAELYSEAIDTQFYSEGGEAVPLKLIGDANAAVKIKQVDDTPADFYDIEIMTVVT